MLHAVQVEQSMLLGQYWSTVAEAERAEAGAEGASEQAVDTLSTRMHATAADMAAVSAKLKSSGPDARVPDLSAEMRPVASDARVVAALCTGYGVKLTNQP